MNISILNRAWGRSRFIYPGVCLLVHLACSSPGAERPRLELAGLWDFYPDVGDATLEPVTASPGKITAQGCRLFLNGQALYLSDYGDDATEPITGMLPADKALYLQRLGLKLIAGGGLLEAEAMPTGLHEGSIVWGLRLTGWISPEKNLHRVVQYEHYDASLELVCLSAIDPD